LERHEQTGKKAALIVTSSGLGFKPIPGFLAYSATKNFASYIAEGLNYELKGKVDVMSYQPGEVKTKMTARMKQNFRFLDVDKAVSSCFRDIGLTPKTFGAARHELAMLAFDLVPFSQIQGMMWKNARRAFQKRKDAIEKKKAQG